MLFDAIQGQPQAIESLRRMIASERVPSALAFLGPPHVGKRTTALALAMALNCTRDGGEGCGACPPCRKIAEGVHPDVEVIIPDGTQIRIDQVRAVTEGLGLIPFEAGKRVVILSQAECLNDASANAFLKTLEEPPADTLIVLCAPGRGFLPETILSRCLPLRFHALSEATVRELFAKQGGLEEPALDFAVRFARGRLRPEIRERAQAWLGVRDELLEGLERQKSKDFHGISDKFSRWSGSEDWKFVLEFLETWFRDVALLGGGAPQERLINRDRGEVLQRWCGRFPPPRAEACFRKVLAVREGLAFNVNRPLALETLWLDIKEISMEGGTA